MISAILLAAGESKRMQGENKLTKLYNGLPLIQYSITNILNSSVNELIIVLGYQSEIISNLVSNNKKIKIVINKNYPSGMSSSIKLGLKNLSKLSNAFFICLADMPLIDTKVYEDLIKSKKNNEIIIPTYKGQWGNPVLFSSMMVDEIIKIKGDIGAKSILEKKLSKIKLLPIKNKSIILDFDTQDNFK